MKKDKIKKIIVGYFKIIKTNIWTKKKNQCRPNLYFKTISKHYVKLQNEAMLELLMQVDPQQYTN